ncbi:MAG: polysaccharide deacetylase family protein [Clostridia bacterium]|nr:polysaccharide deacetylase family protein [Clostridia bacterium]
MFNGKMKAVTFSYDDNVKQDKRFIELLNKYGLKGTFNLNSQRFGDVTLKEAQKANIKSTEAESVYEGHEIAVHTLTHPDLVKLSDEEIIREVEEDRLILSEIAGYEVVGMAYSYGTYDERVVNLLKSKTGVKYSRTVSSTYNFEPQSELLTFNPTLHHNDKKLFEIAENFINLKTDKPQIFYIWGHTYEFDHEAGMWERIEEFMKLISRKDDIFYGTNKEILLK